MKIETVRNLLDSLMILSFLIFGALSALILITDTSLSARAVSIPFAFLFISMMTLIITGQIDERPKMTDKLLKQWILIVVPTVLVSSLVFILS